MEQDQEALRRITNVPKKMKALQYSAPEKFAVVELDLPEIGPEDVLVKISACGVCGTDLHYHKGEFLAKWPLIPGHEATGTIARLGSSISPHSLPLNTPIVADPMQPCLTCFHCQRRKPLLCSNMTAYGGNVPGGFAEYVRYPARLVHAVGKSRDLPRLEAVLVEPAACALHGIERIREGGGVVGSRVLLFGCGPTGCLLAQLVRLNGAAHLTIASKPGPKLDIARKMRFADEFVEIPETAPHVEMNALKEANSFGFDVVIEATGSPAVLEASLDYVRKGGALVVYGVYDEAVKIAWSPFRIWENEITILASFCSQGHMPHTFRIEEWADALEAVRMGSCVKAAIVFDQVKRD
ncbi:GroES-like protein [Setomelanomma holmii]|uniref:GroES-like protein n=1 Tax=Setomelanomma holmii TaxID=210430 RepID=A0A9P4LGK5_9PLEO|nr:GroES-like protein [Setomelanomma holmii]